MGFSIKGLVQKFFPETVDLKVLFADPNKSNLLNHIMSGTVYDEKSTKKQVHKGIIKAVENGEQYYSWRKKSKMKYKNGLRIIARKNSCQELLSKSFVIYI